MSTPGSSKKVTVVQALSCFIIIAAVSLSSCSGGGGGGISGTPATCTCPTGTPFWATNLTTSSLYCVCADQVATGTHSRIFVEHGMTFPPALTGLQAEFDTRIYPTDTANFGNEPNPGIDGDPLITILLLNIKDGFNGTTSTSFTAGYFDPGNEYPLSAYPFSNQREMFYMNINPAVLPYVTPTDFFKILAHEFQHMIHWEQKNHLRNLDDPTWLNEAMSEIAPTYLYGPSYARVLDYEQAPSDSLTVWNGLVSDYGIAYMWSQYFNDTFPIVGSNIFKKMMEQNSIGITSVNGALQDAAVAALYPGKTFDNTFSDLSIAIISGMSTTWVGHPEWSYTSIDTMLGNYPGGVALPGLLVSGNLHQTSPTTLPALGPWSIGFSWYAPSVTTPNGTVTWTAASSSQKATFIESTPTADTITTDITSGATYSYSTTGIGILIVTNPSIGSIGSGGGVVSTSLLLATGPAIYQSPKQMLAAANERSQAEGRPRNVCVHSAFLEQEKELRKKGFKPGF